MAINTGKLFFVVGVFLLGALASLGANAQTYAYGGSYTNTDGSFVLANHPDGAVSYIEEYKNGVYQRQLASTSSGRTVSVTSSGSYEYRFIIAVGEICDPWFGCFTVPPQILGSTYVTVNYAPIPTVPGSISYSGLTGGSSDVDGNFTVHWGSSGNSPTSYKLELGNGTGNWSQIYSGGNTSLAFTNQGNGVYQFRVRACNANGCSGYTAASQTFMVMLSPTPGSISASDLSHSSSSQDTNGAYSLSWGNSSNYETTYTMQENINGGGYLTIKEDSGTSVSFSNKGNATYSYRVKACNLYSCSGWSAIKSIQVIHTPSVPGAISGPSSNTSGTFSFSWGAASGNVSKYTLQRSTGTWNTIQDANLLNRNESGLGDNNYSYRVRACNSLSCSGWTATKTINVTSLPGTPGAITFSDLEETTVIGLGQATLFFDYNGYLTLNWGAASNSPTSYQIQQAFAPAEGGVFGAWAETDTASGLSFAATYPDGSYKFRVRACKGTICGGYSAESSIVQVFRPPSAPGAINGPSSDEDGTYAITWGASTGSNIHYVLEVNSALNKYELSSLSNPTFSLTDQFAGTYQYRVRACNVKCSSWTAYKSVIVTQGSGSGVISSTASYQHPMPVNVDMANRLNIAIPIDMPKGIGDVAPVLSFKYKSIRDESYDPRRPFQDYPSFIGHGWDLNGISVIAYCSDDTATYCLDGQELRTDVVNGQGTFLRPAEAPETLIQIKNVGTSSSWFEMKAGSKIFRYGKTSEGKAFSNTGSQRFWYLQEVVDEFNNVMTINYEPSGIVGLIQPTEINFGGNKVEFLYAPRRESFDPNDDNTTGEILEKVRTFSSGNLIREYTLFNQFINGLEHTDAIQMCAYEQASAIANCIPAMTFEWRESLLQWTTDPVTMITDFNNLEQWELWKINGNRIGITGIVDTLGQSTTIEYELLNMADFIAAQNGNEPSLVDWTTDWAAETQFAYGFMQNIVGADEWVVRAVEKGYGDGSPRRTEYHKIDYRNSEDDTVKGVSRLIKLPDGNTVYEIYGPHNGPFPDMASGGKLVYQQEYTGAYGAVGSKLVSARSVNYRRQTKDYCGPYACQSSHISKVYVGMETQYIIDDGGQIVGAIINNNEVTGWDAVNGIVTEKVSTAITGYGTQFGLGDHLDFDVDLNFALSKFDTIESIVTTTTDYDQFYNYPDYNIENWFMGFGNRQTTEYSVPGRTGSKKVQKTITPSYGYNSRKSFKVNTETFSEFKNGGFVPVSSTSSLYDGNGNIRSITTSDLLGISESRQQVFDEYLNNRFPQHSRRTLSAGVYEDTYFSYDTHLGVADLLTDANGQITTLVFDAFGREIIKGAPNGTKTRTRYEQCDATCPVVNEVPAVRKVTVTTTQLDNETLLNPLKTDLDENTVKGSPVTITYSDIAGRTIREEVLGFSVGQRIFVDTWYDAVGRVDKKSLPYSNGLPSYIQYFYDERGRNWKTVNPDGSSVETSYQQLSNSLETISTETIIGNGGTKYFTRYNRTNSLGQLTRSIDAYNTSDAVVTDYEYDNGGNNDKVIVDNNPNTTVTSVFDYAGKPTQINDPSAGTINLVYDGFGQLRSQTDARGIQTTFDYDAAGRIIERIDGDGSALQVVNTFTFDTRLIGFLSTKASDNGFTEDYFYDPDGYSYLTQIVTHINTAGIDGVNAIDKTYSTDMTYDEFGRLYTQNYPSGFVTRAEYNDRGYASAGYDHSTGLRLNSITATDEGMTEFTLGYGAGQYTTVHTYNPLNGQLTSLETGGGLVQDYSYDWWSNGTLNQRSTSAITSATETFGYDNLNRLDSAVTSHGSGTRSLVYSYDNLGNITKRKDNSGGFNLSNYNYNTSNPNQLQSVSVGGVSQSYGYDNSGAAISINSTASGKDRTITYNAYGKPIDIRKGTISGSTIASPTAREQFTYGPDGSRFYKKSKNGSTYDKTVYLFGGMFEVVYPATGVNTAIEKTTVGNVMHIREVKTASYDTRLEFIHKDHLGSVDVITDESGNVVARDQFDPYGTRRAVNWSGVGAPPPIPFQQLHTTRGFTGHEQLDSVGLIHMNGRVYDPEVGRFISPDPIVQAPRYSQSYNRYAYVWNNPVGNTDPSGYSCKSATGLKTDNCGVYVLAEDGKPRKSVEPDFEIIIKTDDEGNDYICYKGWSCQGVVGGTNVDNPFAGLGPGILVAQNDDDFAYLTDRYTPSFLAERRMFGELAQQAAAKVDKTQCKNFSCTPQLRGVYIHTEFALRVNALAATGLPVGAEVLYQNGIRYNQRPIGSYALIDGVYFGEFASLPAFVVELKTGHFPTIYEDQINKIFDNIPYGTRLFLINEFNESVQIIPRL